MKQRRHLTSGERIEIWKGLEPDSNLKEIANNYRVCLDSIQRIFWSWIEAQRYCTVELGQKTEPYYETEIDLENSFNLVYLPSDLKGEELEIYKELIKP